MIEDGKKPFDLIKSLQNCNHVIFPQKIKKHILNSQSMVMQQIILNRSIYLLITGIKYKFYKNMQHFI